MLSATSLGVWASVTVIEDPPGLITDDLCSSIDLVTSYSTLEMYQQNGNHRRDQLRFAVFSNPRRIDTVLQSLTKNEFFKVYVHCSEEFLNDFDRLSDTFPNKCSAYRKIKALRYALSFDLSDCMVKIGEFYDRLNQKDLAQRRYRYAYRLRFNVQLELQSELANTTFDA